MYICADCGLHFEDPATYEERHGLSPFEGPGERFGMCPYCGSTYYHVATQCARCGKWIAEDFATFAENEAGDDIITVCEECARELKEFNEIKELNEKAAQAVEWAMREFAARRKRRNLQRIATVLCGVLVALLLGSVGALDVGLITLKQFALRMAVLIPAILLSGYIGRCD